jgi:hypothetical protein
MNPEDKRKNDHDPNAFDDAGPADTDSHGTPIRRVPGPGPKDAGKGAAGEDALKRPKG